jgi:hypothetical protein
MIVAVGTIFKLELGRNRGHNMVEPLVWTGDKTWCPLFATFQNDKKTFSSASPAFSAPSARW